MQGDLRMFAIRIPFIHPALEIRCRSQWPWTRTELVRIALVISSTILVVAALYSLERPIVCICLVSGPMFLLMVILLQEFARDNADPGGFQSLPSTNEGDRSALGSGTPTFRQSSWTPMSMLCCSSRGKQPLEHEEEAFREHCTCMSECHIRSFAYRPDLRAPPRRIGKDLFKLAQPSSDGASTSCSTACRDQYPRSEKEGKAEDTSTSRLRRLIGIDDDESIHLEHIFLDKWNSFWRDCSRDGRHVGPNATRGCLPAALLSRLFDEV